MSLATERNASVEPAQRKRGLLTNVPPRQRAKRSNNPLSSYDLTSQRGRRIADLYRAYASALGNPLDVGRQCEIVTAAELQVLAEEARAAALENPAGAALDRVVRMQGAADRALRRLGIKPGAVAPDTRPLHQRLAALRPARTAPEAKAIARATVRRI
jgi:hypothetical protein